MTNETFEKVAQHLIHRALAIRRAKARNYTHEGDCLENFTRGGVALGVEREQYAIHLSTKQWLALTMAPSIIHLSRSLVMELLCDILNYLILVYAMWLEDNEDEGWDMLTNIQESNADECQ